MNLKGTIRSDGEVMETIMYCPKEDHFIGNRINYIALEFSMIDLYDITMGYMIYDLSRFTECFRETIQQEP